MGNRPLAATLALLSLLLMTGESRAATVREERPAMGTIFEVTVVASDDARAKEIAGKVFDEVERIEGLISEWRPTSEVSAINAAAGDHPVKVSPEVFDLLRRSVKVSELTEGAFDITWLTVGKLWDMKAEHPTKPSQQNIDALLSSTGYRNIVFDAGGHSVFLKTKQTRIGLGGIGQGYAANRGVVLMRQLGATGGIVNGSGDLMTFGKREDGASWRIGIKDPFHSKDSFAYLTLTNEAIVTSGDYERFVVIDGKRYSHILDPRTGYPVEELRSVTIICPDAELADALATGVTVMGTEKGLALVNRLKDVHALLVDRDGKLHFSRHLESMMEERKQ